MVVDTNVFVSSFFGGNPKRVIDFWKVGKIILCLSDEIFEEYTKVLKRMGLEGRDEFEELLALWGQGYNTVFTAKTPSLQIVKEDPNDDKFIECAVALEAEVVVTGDKALLAVGRYMGIKIMNAKTFLDSIR